MVIGWGWDCCGQGHPQEGYALSSGSQAAKYVQAFQLERPPHTMCLAAIQNGKPQQGQGGQHHVPSVDLANLVYSGFLQGK
eukprot:scaffold201225_cov21-Tisochrysis_lutea.AAC.1